MKALVLSEGSGSRLRPITHTSAKQLLPWPTNLPYSMPSRPSAAPALTDVGIVAGDTASAIREVVGDGSHFGLNATYIRQDASFGLAQAVLIARDFLGDDDFVMYLGDNFIVGGITALVEEFRSSQPDAQIMLTRVSDPCQFGVVQLDTAGRVIKLEEKPKQPQSDFVLAGVYIFTSAVHKAVEQLTPLWRGELEIIGAIQWLIDNGHEVRSTTIAGYWKDTRNVADMLEVNRMVLEDLEPLCRGTADGATELIGRVVLEADAEVSNSRVVGPAIIGAGSRVSGSYIGPFTSVARECSIIDSEIEYSIVLRGASIRGVGRIEASLIGQDVDVTPAPMVPKAHRLVLGDHSKVQISS